MSEREESFDNWCDELGPERDLPLLAFNAGWNAALQSEAVRGLAEACAAVLVAADIELDTVFDCAEDQAIYDDGLWFTLKEANILRRAIIRYEDEVKG